MPRRGADLLALTLLLLLVAGALLGVSLATGGMAWAWASAGTSALAAVLLLVRAWRGRRGRARQGRHLMRRGGRAAPEVVAESNAPEAPPRDEVADEEPAEEDTDAADLLIVHDLEDEVQVVDEYPRYHLSGCSVLAACTPEALPAREARELGFTPCARCGPDAELAARYRTASTT